MYTGTENVNTVLCIWQFPVLDYLLDEGFVEFVLSAVLMQMSLTHYKLFFHPTVTMYMTQNTSHGSAKFIPVAVVVKIYLSSYSVQYSK